MPVTKTRDEERSGSREMINKTRLEVIESMAKTLGIPADSATYKEVRDRLHNRMQTELHAGDSTQHYNKHESNHTCAIASLNMRGMNNKLTSLEGIELWEYCKSTGVQALLIQDHKMHDKTGVKIQSAARAVMPSMANSVVTMQHGHDGKTKGTKVGGTATLIGGALAKYKATEIKDPRGWGRFSGRLIEGQQQKCNRNRNAHNGLHGRHTKSTTAALISVYAAVESAEANSMWQQQIRKISNLPLAERVNKQHSTTTTADLAGGAYIAGDPHGQLRKDLSETVQQLRREHQCNIIIM